MPTRDERKAAAASNLALMRGAFSKDTQETIDAAIIYEDGEGRELELPEVEEGAATTTSVTSDFAVKAVHSAKGKTVVVDPCSFMRPGGAYEDGAFGPEQILCSESNLYPVLCGCKNTYHAANRGFASGQLYTDRALYLPQVTFVHDGDIRRADVLAIPEPNRTHALENHRSEREIGTALRARVEALLRIAAANGTETLIVGAFGAGPQGFDAEVVIELFRSWIAAHAQPAFAQRGARHARCRRAVRSQRRAHPLRAKPRQPLQGTRPTYGEGHRLGASSITLLNHRQNNAMTHLLS